MATVNIMKSKRSQTRAGLAFILSYCKRDSKTIYEDRKMSIRISEENLALIHQKAIKAKLNFTDYVTRACLGKQIVIIDGLNEILKEQKAIGRNLNQLTLLANMGRVEAVNLTALTKRYAELNATLTELLERKRWSDGNG